MILVDDIRLRVTSAGSDTSALVTANNRLKDVAASISMVENRLRGLSTNTLFKRTREHLEEMLKPMASGTRKIVKVGIEK